MDGKERRGERGAWMWRALVVIGGWGGWWEWLGGVGVLGVAVDWGRGEGVSGGGVLRFGGGAGGIDLGGWGKEGWWRG